MRNCRNGTVLLVGLVWLGCFVAASSAEASPPTKSEAASPEYDRDIRPILARNCFACHGPDEASREADLRLDQSAVQAVDPESPLDSELILRIRSEDQEVLMPPAESGKKLTANEKQLIESWVLQGASYQRHWAFVPPTQREVPVGSAWAKNEIDHFVEQRIRAANITASAEAHPQILIRRLTLDLTGLLPSIEDVDAFALEYRHAPDETYQRWVKKLMDSNRYGERWARPWLDLARYSDTNGYEKDRPRSIWPYRDWVINALNEDKPFDDFSIEQLAGDMLPEASESQRIATGFHRNTMLNEEGGIDPLEYRYYAMVDRVATTGTVWMGLTIGCAQCHSHKYDPISHRDYYQMMALLNNADEPDVEVTTDAIRQRKRRIESQLESLVAELESQFPSDRELEVELSEWIKQKQQRVSSWTVAVPVSFHSNLPKLERMDDNSIFASGDFTKRDEYKIELDCSEVTAPISAIRLEVLPDDRLPAAGPGRAYYEGRQGDFFLSELQLEDANGPLKFKSGSRSYGKIAVGSGNAVAANVFDGEGSTGWSTANGEGRRHTLVLNLEQPVDAKRLTVNMLFERHFVAALGRFRFSVTTKPEDSEALGLSTRLEQILLRSRDQWSPTEIQAVRSAFLRDTELLAEARKPIEKLEAQLRERTTTLVMQERPADNRRKTYRHHRGEWLSPREQVVPGVPEIFSRGADREEKSGTQTSVSNRLGFARWLVSRQNPLVARVVVNRAWRQLMGHGLVRSDGDFGTQAEPPTHPKLLDWLAVEFMNQGWSMKWLHRKIVTSATYRQQSRLTDELRTTDPTNQLYARGPRYRVDAETIRDMMLCASGLLSDKIGGPSVKPPQPDSVTSLAYGSPRWNASEGDARYRRSLYTFNKRTAPFAAFTTFDAPTGENCIVKRSRSNTPLQALTLLNDQMYTEMAEAMGKLAAEHAAELRGKDDSKNAEELLNAPDPLNGAIKLVFRRLLSRKPTERETERLRSFYRQQSEQLAEDKNATPAEIELGAYTRLARVLMNLDEVIMQH